MAVYNSNAGPLTSDKDYPFSVPHVKPEQLSNLVGQQQMDGSKGHSGRQLDSSLYNPAPVRQPFPI